MTDTLLKNRRQSLKLALGIAGAAVAAKPLNEAFAAVCGKTPAQIEGPFYPVEEQMDTDADLTFVKDRTERALGQVVYVKGKILDTLCRPVAGATVEIWQACASGKYNHPSDTDNPAPLDLNFQYWGRVISGSDGSYLFKTIVPGSYPAATGWDRPPHIHVKVHKRGFFELTTQMYFEGNALNSKDRILQSLSRDDQKKVVVAFLPAGDGFETGALLGNFEMAIQQA